MGSNSEVARTDLLRAKIYPASDDIYPASDDTSSPLEKGPAEVCERIEFTYSRQGDIITMKDPNETTHAYEFDKLGRETQDQITAFGPGIDQGVKRIETGYDTKRLLRTRVTSYDDATVGMGAVVNEVVFVYDDFSQLIADKQEHDGAVDGSTPAVEYAYEDGSRANTSRRTSLTYPDGRQHDYGYGANGSAEDRLSRIKTLAIAGEAFDLCAYTCAGAARYVRIAYPQPGVELSYLRPAGAPLGDAGDPYSGYDRFRRTIDMRWVPIEGGSELDPIQYGYGRANNRTWRRNLAVTDGGQDHAYTYDGLYQVAFLGAGQREEDDSAWPIAIRQAGAKGFKDQFEIDDALNHIVDQLPNQDAEDDDGKCCGIKTRIVGFSWGGWSALILAKRLQNTRKINHNSCRTVEVLGTLDPVKTRRFRARDKKVPENVELAINLFQTNGCIRTASSGCWPLGGNDGENYKGESLGGAYNIDVSNRGVDFGRTLDSSSFALNLGFQYPSYPIIWR